MRWMRRRQVRSVIARTNGATADGKDVWSWRPDAGVKLAGGDLQATAARKPRHRARIRATRWLAMTGLRPCVVADLGRETPRVILRCEPDGARAPSVLASLEG